MTMTLGIKLENIRKIYPRKIGDQLASVAMSALGRSAQESQGGIALADISLSIQEGERVGIIGRNGAGKSTLLRILAGVSEQTSGYMSISGNVTAVLTLGVGLREDLSGRENIYIDGQAQGKTREEIETNIAAIVEFAELGKFIDLPLLTYSTGMKARLAFAMITQIDPEILIIDEALSVGDSAFSIKAGKRIAELCARGAIVIIVSHSMGSIRELCNRCLWIDRGKVIMDGTPETVTRVYVETVQSEDDVEQLARFRSLVGSETIKDGYSLGEINLLSDDHMIRRLTSGKSLQIKFDYNGLSARTSKKIVFRCERLDGVLIFEETLQIFASMNSQQFCISCPCFNLAPSLYKLQFVLIDDVGEPLARSTAVIEVVCEDIPTGGRPILMGMGHIESFCISEGA